MRLILVDANLLIYAVNADPPQHEAAQLWFRIRSPLRASNAPDPPVDSLHPLRLAPPRPPSARAIRQGDTYST